METHALIHFCKIKVFLIKSYRCGMRKLSNELLLNHFGLANIALTCNSNKLLSL